jgi:hypothetical protein
MISATQRAGQSYVASLGCNTDYGNALTAQILGKALMMSPENLLQVDNIPRADVISPSARPQNEISWKTK